ncbi:MAG: YdeI/OmpD-associated family protein [Candidatus Diapherotrites archaeon]|nr:YdeI/OmpD-associated family protein [Candidatus Diapherotrites archaeon]
MKIGKLLYLDTRKQWRSWLAKNHDKEKEIWLVYYRKSSGKKRIPYAFAVEEALCYGWIDSILKTIDEEKFAQRFSPRKPNSMLSEMNKERIRRLIKKNKMTSAGLKAVKHLFDKSKHMDEELIIASDILKALKSDKTAWNNFQNYSEGYKKVRIGYIEHLRNRKELFNKSLNHFIKMTAKNKQFGSLK